MRVVYILLYVGAQRINGRIYGILVLVASISAFQADGVGSSPIYPSRLCKVSGTQLVIMRWFVVERNGPDTDRVNKACAMS